MKTHLTVVKQNSLSRWIHLLIFSLFLASCAAQATSTASPTASPTSTPSLMPATPTELIVETATPLPTRGIYDPGTLVDYIAQDGDTLPALAAHFNTTEKEIRDANPELPATVTTLPAGLPMKMPIYYMALWGSPYRILPDSLFVNGPAQVDFNTVEFVNSQPGWLKNYSALAGEQTRKGGDLIDYVAWEFSISPRLLLAIAEFQAGALSSPQIPDDKVDYTLGYEDRYHKGFYLQLVWAANTLNNGYYQWRSGTINTINLLDGTLEHPDPWQNASSVALQNYFSQILTTEQYRLAISADGFNAAYTRLFGDPWQNVMTNIPGSLEQPSFRLPIEPGKTWAFTGAPHSAWGSGDPLAALDFAPPSAVGKCSSSTDYAVAVADGEISRVDKGVAMLDLDGDGDDRTGWVVLYLHISSYEKVRQGQLLKAGDFIGHPSCEGGSSTGTHVHIARKYNGEWMLADGALAFNLDGWVAHNGTNAYLGFLIKNGKIITASEQAAPTSLISVNK